MIRTTSRVTGRLIAVIVESCSRCGEMRSAGWWGLPGWNEATLHAYRSNEWIRWLMGFVMTDRGVECERCIKATNEESSK